LVSWLITRPLSVSAVCCTSVPTSVTGAMNPDSGIEMYSTGIEHKAQSTRFCEVTSLHFRGAVGQHEKTVSGFAASSSFDPLTASCRSLITLKASVVKVPVTTGFSQNIRLR
jgi:hypothetical protein